MSVFSSGGSAVDHMDPDAANRTPGQGDNQVVAVFDSNDAASLARDALVASGIARSAIHVFARTEHADGATAAAHRRQAFWDAVGSLFARSEDPATYHLAADHNHAVVVLTPAPGTDLQRALQILRASGPVDLYPTLGEAKRA